MTTTTETAKRSKTLREWFDQENVIMFWEPIGRQYGGAERQETDEAKAQRILVEKLKPRE